MDDDAALQDAVWRLDRRVRERSLPALRLVAGDQEWIVGDGEPLATVTAAPADLARAVESFFLPST